MEEHLSTLRALRHELHRHPDLSGNEQMTAKHLHQFITKYTPDEVITGIGGAGFLVIYNGKQPGKTVAIRAELDALPIAEINDFDYKSARKGVAHKCGHDGHMVMVAGLAALLEHERPTSGRVVLLFQPAEETGQGAQQMLHDGLLEKLSIDYIFALHNLPGYKKGSIVIKDNVFASASAGLIIHLKGKTSHAAEPEKGISPAAVLATLIEQVPALADNLPLRDFALATIIHSRLGEMNFGVFPGEGIMGLTLRASYDDDLQKLQQAICDLTTKLCEREGLTCSFQVRESFHTTLNDSLCCNTIRMCAQEQSFPLIEAEVPFRWSEDFGLFTQKVRGAMFGLGAGKTTPALHNPDYDFPDEITCVGVNMFFSIIKKLLY